MNQPSRKIYIGLLILLAMTGLAITKSGLLSKGTTARPAQAVEVKAMQVAQRDTPINYEFVGKVTSKNEVKIMSKVSGNIVAKMVNGGDTVYKGQPLFRIDNKQYTSAVHTAAATLAKSQATLNNSKRDLERYRRLAEVKGVAQQSVDSYEAQAEEDAATVAANQAALEQARQDEQDTLILSPVDGRIDVNDLSTGSFAAAGSTVIATVSSLDPIWVQFSMSENEYITFAKLGQGGLPENFRNNLTLVLSEGSEYPLTGKVEQLDKGINDTTGTITIKAAFGNPQRFLVPGMFAKIIAPGEVRTNAIVVPQRAVKDLLDNSFVYVIKADNTVDSRQVKLGPKVGNMVVVEEGLNPDDTIVVEGIDKVKPGSMVQATVITEAALDTSVNK